jgi:hypothetical protein
VPSRADSNSGRTSVPRCPQTRQVPRFEIRQPDLIGPAVGIDHNGMRAFVVAAVDDEPDRAGFAHFAQCDFLLACHGSSLPKFLPGLNGP